MADFRAVYDIDPELLRILAVDCFPEALLTMDMVETYKSRIPDAEHNGLFLCLKAQMEKSLGDVIRQGDTLLALARRWPADPLGWVNMMNLCCEQGAWDGAKICIKKAPINAWFFHLYANLIKQTDRRDREATRPIVISPFYGQNDLGGIMRASGIEYELGEQ